MDSKRSVLVIGLLPEVADFSAFPGLTPERVRAGVQVQIGALAQLGYDAVSCFVDMGDTAEATLREWLATRPFACVCIGAGIRVPAGTFALFEKVVNVVHAAAPQAKICFNTVPGDTVDAVKRWIPAGA